MRRANLKTMVKNLLILVIGAVPVFFLLVWLQSLMTGVEGSAQAGYMLETGVFFFLTILAPVTAGGVIHQGVLWIASSTLSNRAHRLAAVVTTPIIPAAVVASGFRLEVMLWFTVPLVISLIAYAFVIRMPRTEPETTVFSP